MAGTEFDFNQSRPLGVTRLDTAYTGPAEGDRRRARVELDHPDGLAGVSLWCDERFGYPMVFSGDTLDPAQRRTALAVEPMSCPPDAFRSGTDLVTLPPGVGGPGRGGSPPARGRPYRSHRSLLVDTAAPIRRGGAYIRLHPLPRLPLARRKITGRAGSSCPGSRHA